MLQHTIPTRSQPFVNVGHFTWTNVTPISVKMKESVGSKSDYIAGQKAQNKYLLVSLQNIYDKINVVATKPFEYDW